MVCLLCDEDYLASTCMVIMIGKRFCTRDEESCTFGSHGRVKVEMKSGFIYLQYNTAATLKSPYFDTTTILLKSGKLG